MITGLPGEPPIQDGAVVLDDRGRVLAVGRAEALRASYGRARVERVRAVLTPGLVNAHVHLELSALRGETRSGGGFGPWVASMMETRATRAPEADAEAIEAAVSELLRAGTSAVGEVTNTLRSVPALTGVPLLGRLFHEVFGLSREAARGMLARARTERAALGELPSSLGYALSPHTLYSLHPDVLREIVEEARTSSPRTSLHLAEHAAEHAFLRDGSGPFATFLGQRGVPMGDFTPPGCPPVDYAEALSVLGPGLIAVHLAAASPDELRKVAASGAHAVLCPRSNLFIELKLPPLYEVLAAGLRPGLGTDSLASNTTLDVLAEAAALADRFPQANRGTLFSMASFHGAEALGLAHRVGALRAGLSPGLLAFDLAQPIGDPLRYLLRSPPPARRVLARPALPSGSETLEEPA